MKPERIICEFYIPNSDNNDHCVHYIAPVADPIGLCKQSGKFQCVQDLYDHLPSLSHSSRMQWSHCRFAWYLSKIVGVEIRDHHLPFLMKAGAIWDEFQQAIYKGEKFKAEFNELSKKYALWPEEQAKIYALIKAWFTIGFNLNLKSKCQKEFYILEDDLLCHGFIDRAYSTHFVESKSGANPTRYHKLLYIISQCSTYFLSDPDYEYCIIEVVKIPQLQYNQSKETPDSYMNRCYDHIISKPKEYFPGLDLDAGTFGKKFMRSEFPLKRIKKDFINITRDIQRAIAEDSFYQNFLACSVPTQCLYYDICRLSLGDKLVISEEKYQYREKEVK